MGLFDWLFGGNAETAPSRHRAPDRPIPRRSQPKERDLTVTDTSSGSFQLEVVGESHYQNAIRRARREANDDTFRVLLLREPENRHDPDAVRVVSLQSQTLGYLGRENAARYGDAIKPYERKGKPISCMARSVGGHEDRPSIGIWLDAEDPTEW